ncbi:MAG: hypothetical protein JXQ72_16355 [Anaerolineae bacterium]|nr:hypothetical protein [Anaerolineae bacterium]
MPGLYDRLTDRLGDDDDQPSGLTPFDLMDLPGDQRRVMTVLLRVASPDADGVALAALQDKLPDLEDLPGTLAALTGNDWLIAMGEAPNQRYKINLRRKRGSQLAGNLWSSLTDRLAGDSPDSDTDASQDSGTDSGPVAPRKPSMSDW